jgi:hypothetical protein
MRERREMRPYCRTRDTGKSRLKNVVYDPSINYGLVISGATVPSDRPFVLALTVSFAQPRVVTELRAVHHDCDLRFHVA